MTGHEMTMRFHGLKQVHNAVPWQNVIRHPRVNRVLNEPDIDAAWYRDAICS